ncbi:YdcF family protein [Thalassobacillus cyri]|uniref:YdcF family protein n=1 Tax=Thalassobacillus cyri TaxID=571932 RepID=UPI0015A4D638|nr:YdcF family protein [Thalassobacillus cyri]
MKKVKSIILVTVVAGVIGIIGIPVTIAILGPESLIIESKPERSDAIIVLSGNKKRLGHAAGLYHDNYADYVILSNSKATDTTKEAAIQKGIPEDAIIEERKASSTFENAQFTEEIMKNNNLQSAIVVTSDYHSRRSKITFERIYDDDITLSYSVAPSNFNPDDGVSDWEHLTFVGEYVKLLGYSIKFLLS